MQKNAATEDMEKSCEVLSSNLDMTMEIMNSQSLNPHKQDLPISQLDMEKQPQKQYHLLLIFWKLIDYWGKGSIQSICIPAGELTTFCQMIQNPRSNEWYQLNSVRCKTKLYECREEIYVEEEVLSEIGRRLQCVFWVELQNALYAFIKLSMTTFINKNSEWIQE